MTHRANARIDIIFVILIHRVRERERENPASEARTSEKRGSVRGNREISSKKLRVRMKTYIGAGKKESDDMKKKKKKQRGMNIWKFRGDSLVW